MVCVSSPCKKRNHELNFTTVRHEEYPESNFLDVRCWILQSIFMSKDQVRNLKLLPAHPKAVSCHFIFYRFTSCARRSLQPVRAHESLSFSSAKQQYFAPFGPFDLYIMPSRNLPWFCIPTVPFMASVNSTGICPFVQFHSSPDELGQSLSPSSRYWILFNCDCWIANPCHMP